MDIDEKNMNEFARQFKKFSDNKSSKIKSPKKFDSFTIFQGECIYVFDFSSNEIVYANGFQKFLGYQDNEITFDFIFKNVHPDDVDMVSRVVRATAIYCSEYEKNSSENLLSIKYRRRRKDGTYIKVLSQSTIYERYEDGGPSKSFTKLTDISFIDNTENVNWTFKANNLNETIFKEQINKVYKDFFTEREIEIIFEIEKGLTNSLIATNLKISEHTVATHRKNILKKSNCHNSDELILFCEAKGIISNNSDR
jgi:DNA-binding CsgD family transcriptional regulator